MHGTRGPIVVGVDGSAASFGALRWAIREATTRGLQLQVLHGAGCADPRLWAVARAMVAEAVAEARAPHAAFRAQGSVVDGAPITELCTASQTASLVVLGSRGIGGFPELRLGSVASQVALHGGCPVVIVHDAESWSPARQDLADRPVVVGANSSPDSDQALRAAFSAAQAHGAPLIAVRTWRPQMAAHRGTICHARVDEASTTSSKHFAVSEAVARWSATYPEVSVDVKVVMGSAAATLVSASAEAQLIVLGSRGHGEPGGVRLGATTIQVLNHAKCPVMVVRQHQREPH